MLTLMFDEYLKNRPSQWQIPRITLLKAVINTDWNQLSILINMVCGCTFDARPHIDPATF